MSVHVNCANCGIEFCLPQAVEDKRREDHKTFYCPNGHSNYYPAATEKERRIRQLELLVEQKNNMLRYRAEDIAGLEHELRSLRSKLAWSRRRERLHLVEDDEAVA